MMHGNPNIKFNNFFFENRAVHGIMWKKVVERGRPQITVLRTRIACKIPKATNTHSEYEMLIVLLLQEWLNELSSVLRCTYIGCLFDLHVV